MFRDISMENTLHNHYNKISSPLLLLQNPKPAGRKNKGEFLKRQGEVQVWGKKQELNLCS